MRNYRTSGMNITRTEHLALLNLDLTSSFIEMNFIQNKSKIKYFLIALVSSVSITQPFFGLFQIIILVSGHYSNSFVCRFKD